MKEIREIIEYLKKEYSKLITMPVKDNFLNWLNDCGNSNIDSKRLLFCIAVDTRYKLVNKQKYVEIFNQMKYDLKLKPQYIFEDTINEYDGKLHCSSGYYQLQKKSKNIYGTLIKLNTFTRYYLSDSHYTADEIRQVRDRLINGELVEINIAKGGYKPREVTWISLISKINEIIEFAKRQNLVIADYLCERLGLYRDHIGTSEDPLPEYIKLQYPENINENFYQPIAINADWKSNDGLYLSYKKEDTFGRTRNLTSGKLSQSIKEQVHFKFNKVYKFYVNYIGKTQKGERDVSTILNDAYRRFKGKNY